jgi:hypothetical protein
MTMKRGDPSRIRQSVTMVERRPTAVSPSCLK